MVWKMCIKSLKAFNNTLMNNPILLKFNFAQVLAANNNAQVF